MTPRDAEAAYKVAEAAERALHEARERREASESWTGYARDEAEAADKAAHAYEVARVAEAEAEAAYLLAVDEYAEAAGGTPDGDAIALYEARRYRAETGGES